MKGLAEALNSGLLTMDLRLIVLSAKPLSVKSIRAGKERDAEIVKTVLACMNSVLGFKSFRSVSIEQASLEDMHMVRKGQFATGSVMSFAEQFCTFAGQVHPVYAGDMLSTG